MDITTLMGILVSGVLVVSAILMGGPGIWFLDYPSLMIVIGGTMGATLIAYPISEVMSVFGIARNVFLHRYQSPTTLIPIIVQFAKKARTEGILSFEPQLKKLKNPFLVKGIQMAIDGMESSAIEDVRILGKKTENQPRHKMVHLMASLGVSPLRVVFQQLDIKAVKAAGSTDVKRTVS